MGIPHVFIAWADLRTIACDAWLVPGGRGPGSVWREALPDKWHSQLRDEVNARASVMFDSSAEASATAPLPVLTNISGTREMGPGWYVDGARDFLQVATSALRTSGRKPLHGRSRYLLALPLLGTKGGGAASWSGEITALLLPMLREEAARLERDGEIGVDVVLVLIEGPAWAAAQRTRAADPKAFDALPGALVARADALADRARRGGLTIFAGAGLARPAGLPDWKQLLHMLAEQRIERDELKDFDRLNELDRAALIEQRLRPGETLGAATARLIIELSPRIAIGHALLASLPVIEVVTTNYDDLFERASADIGRPCARIPGQPVAAGERFILKMHGSVSDPSSIVLTRGDYLRFQENRSALSGIVQALMLTRHMLFVGFSFTDDNFHRIAHAVRSAVRGNSPTPRGPFGTNLVVGGPRLVADLWRDDLDWLTFKSGDAPSIADEGRLVEIFLDRLSAQATTVTSHLGVDVWAGALSDGERLLRTRLEKLDDQATAAERSSPAWTEIESLLSRLSINGRRT